MVNDVYKYWLIVFIVFILVNIVYGDENLNVNAGAIFFYLFGAYTLAPLILKKEVTAPYGGKLKVGEDSVLRFILFILYSLFVLSGLLASVGFDWSIILSVEQRGSGLVFRAKGVRSCLLPFIKGNILKQNKRGQKARPDPDSPD